MITKGTASSCFAGDATFKTLENEVSMVKIVMSTEESFKPFRLSAKVSCYLYNVVAQAYPGLTGTKGIVVARFMMNRLTRDSYCMGWQLFLDHMQTYWRRTVSAPQSLCLICVPYVFNVDQCGILCIELRSITTDFDAAEI